MKYRLKDYQRRAVDNLKKHFDAYFNLNGKTIVFKAPTGSGKTFMVSALMEELVLDNEDKDFCFLWASIGKGELQIQSYEAVKSYLGGNPKCSLIDNEFFGSRQYIRKNEIVFVNWEKLVDKDSATGAWKNNIMKDQEGMSFIDVLEETRRRGTKIILIVDESHIGAGIQTRIREFKDTIVIPHITLEMSATPLSEPDVIVDTEAVIAEGMIKEGIIVNEGIDDTLILEDDIDSEILVLQKGYEKREELLREYERNGSPVKPLVLIQIPNKDHGEEKIIVIKDFLRGKGITEKNGKLKIWVDKGASFDKRKIKDLDDETEYLVFKVAVATGWDCPRAQILVKFRDGNSETFEIQTIGRILRAAEAKSYENQLLDNAYLFTNLSRFTITKESYNPNSIKTEMSYFRTKFGRPVYTTINLISYYKSRADDYNSADSSFYSYFEKEFCSYFGIEEGEYSIVSVPKMIGKGLKTKINVNQGVLSEIHESTLMLNEEKNVYGETIDVKISDTDISFAYYNLIRENLNGLAYVRSKSAINGAIVETLTKYYYPIPRTEKVMTVQKLVLSNQEIFSTILSRATQKFREKLIEDAGKTGIDYNYEISSSRAYTRDNNKVIDSELSLYQPLRLPINQSNGDVNRLELSFINYLNTRKDVVEWFWKNGDEHMKENFGISYNNGMSTFQPDFIVKFVDGTIGIFDTKPVGDRVEDTRVKAEALYKFIKDTNINRPKNLGKLIGGIVISKKYDSFTRTYKDFRVNTQENYVEYDVDSSDWLLFETLLKNINND